MIDFSNRKKTVKRKGRAPLWKVVPSSSIADDLLLQKLMNQWHAENSRLYEEVTSF